MNVLRVDDVTTQAAVMRDLALIKVSASAATRSEILQLTDVFRARTVDVTNDSLIIEITGTEDKIEGLIEVLRPFGIIEMVRTGHCGNGARIEIGQPEPAVGGGAIEELAGADSNDCVIRDA